MTRLQKPLAKGPTPASSSVGRPGRDRASPFPWATLDRVTRAQVQSLRAVRRWTSAHLDVSRLSEVLGGLLGVPIALRIRKIGPANVASRPEGAVAVVVEPLDGAPGTSATIELETALAACVVALALRRLRPVLVAPGMPSDSVAGAVAAIVAATARRAHRSSHWRVRPGSSVHGSTAGACGPDDLALSFTVLVGDEAFGARLLFSPASPASPAGQAPEIAPWGRAVLASLGATPLRVPLVACTATLSVTEVAVLGPGDVLLLPGWPPEAGGGARGVPGSVLLSAPGSDVGIRADVVDGRRVVLRGHREALSTAEGTMTDEGEQGALVDAIGDVPVVVRVEVGEAVMAARDWASLGAGDIVSLGRRVGEQVVLRIGGIPVARGELVEVDGEVGVRIVARLSEETTVG